MKKIKIENQYIGDKESLFIIAEAGVNHNGKLKNALKLIKEAKKSGANAIKFQTFVPEELVLKKAPKADYHFKNDKSADDHSWFDLLKEQQLSHKDFVQIKKECKNNKIVFISTPYDFSSVDFLDKIDTKIFKISSCDINNYLFLEYVAKKNKPIILSTGMSNFDEIDKAVKTILKINSKLILLHCTSEYPASLEDSNTLMIKKIQEKYKIYSGYSDHVNHHYQAISAVSMGAKVYEKHLTLDKSMEGPDHNSSLDPNEFKDFVNLLRLTEKIIGNESKKITNIEKKNKLKMRKFLVSSREIKKNTKISFEDVKFMRTGGKGLSVSYYEDILGKKINKNIPPFQPLTSKMFTL